MEKIIIQDNDEAAKWRLRVQRRNNVYNELIKLGPVAAMTCSSLLIIPDEFNRVERLTSYSSWRDTLEESPLFRRLGRLRQTQFSKMGYETYSRLEDSINCLGRVITLSVNDLHNEELKRDLTYLKVWCVNTTLSHRSCDKVLDYLKWLSKACQAVFLGSAIPELPFPRPKMLDGRILPFSGPLDFINGLILGVRPRKNGLTLEESRSLAQIASLSRSLPYPSQVQVSKSIEETLDLIKDHPGDLPEIAKRDYRKGLRSVKSRCGIKAQEKTHVSLSSSGSYESSRSEGGRGAYLMKLAKTCCNTEVTESTINTMAGKLDIFGYQPVTPQMGEFMKELIKKYPETPFYLGGFLYEGLVRTPEEMDSFVERTMKRDYPPKFLAKVLNLVCSADLLKIGHYNKPCEVFNNMLLFPFKQRKDRQTVEFVPDKSYLPVRADISIEAGLKTRLTTAALSSYVHFGQQIGHIMRSYLGTDPFLRVGFDEADKLWQTLKAYRKAYESTQQ